MLGTERKKVDLFEFWLLVSGYLLLFLVKIKQFVLSIYDIIRATIIRLIIQK